VRTATSGEGHPISVLISGGGTAGHVFPALALALELRSEGADVRFAGTAHGQEARLVPAAGFAFVEVDARPFARTLSPAALVGPLSAIRALGRCRGLVEGADVVVGMGGYVSVPVGLAAIRSRRPLVLHEQNAVPGLANRLLATRADRVAVAFEEALRRLPRRARTIVTGNPVRAEILAVPAERDVLRKEALGQLELEDGRRTVVVFGGSQGALHLNRAVVGSLDRLSDRSELQVLLITGPAHLDEVRGRLPAGGSLLVRALPYLERMDLAYAVADLVVARAGATTVAELTVCGIPSVLVPYPYATDRHQEANARALQRAGGAAVILDDGIDGGDLIELVRWLLDEPERLRSMGERAAEWARPDAGASLATVVRETPRR
jgi:UDP-N-acetylglucosamine--N-acetylmuramyl-(pentapeptide) pyrophosphoryl-undecaprenol N-acetylglucosamine transferase